MTVRAATWNVYLGADLSKIFAATSPERLRDLAGEVLADVTATDFRSRARGIVAALGEVGWPDLVGTQEVCTWSVDGETWCDYTAELTDAFAEAGADYAVVATAPSFGGTMPIQGGREVTLVGANVTFARRDTVAVRSARGAPYAARLAMPTAMPGVAFDVVRSWSAVAATVEGLDLVFVNTHLEAYDADIRTAQLAEVLAEVLIEAGPALVVGDLNERPDALRLPDAGTDTRTDTWSDAWTDAWAAVHGPDGGWTCGPADPLLRHTDVALDHRIDYLLSRGLSVTDCVRIGHEAPMAGGLWASDHAGVVATYDAG